jgi:uncharacterized membrane protein YjgN (DUF898 family)
MTASRYSVVYEQQLRPGYSIGQIKKNVAKLLKLTEAQAEKLLSMRSVIRRDVDKAMAEKYQQALFNYGVIITLEVVASSRTESDKESLFTLVDVPTVNDKNNTASGMPVNAQKGNVETAEDSVQQDARVNTPDVSDNDALNEQHLPFTFSGNGKEYFNIWIVNIVLSLLTLGIYSAWAKVRNKQYFYGNTLLDGASFEYTAKPLTILKGRVIAFTAIALYYGLTAYLPPAYLLYVYGVFALLFIIVFPWIVVKGLQFNARYSQYRNVSFTFSGTYKEACRVFILWPLTSVFIFFIPYVWQRRAQFFVANSGYGTSSFEFGAEVKEYYSIFWKLLLIGIAAVLVIWIPIVNIAVYVLIGAYYFSHTTNLMYSNSLLKTNGFVADFDTYSYAWLLFTNTLGIVFTLGLYTPWAHVRTAKYKADHITVVSTEGLNVFVQAESEHVNALAEGFADAHDVFDIDVGV